MPAFPIDLRVADRRALVVGGGRIAARRVEALHHCGADVTVVSPRLGAALQRRAVDFTWLERPFRAGDCAGFFVVVSCVDDPAIGPVVYDDAKAHGALVSVADVPQMCEFYFGAIARRGAVTLSVHTDGKAPGMASRLRDELAPILSDRAMARTERFVELRRALRGLDPSPEHAEARADFLTRFTNDEALDALRAPGGIDRALRHYGQPAQPKVSGRVHLVGAGPGDPDLLTVRAARLIQRADALVVDALVPPQIYAGSRAEVFYVGKRAGEARTTQEEIQALLVELAQEGKDVVRLKGGDPGIFGRVDEEREALRAAAIDYDVVPGISNSIAAASAADIAPTSRGVADRVVIMSGHLRQDAPEDLPDVPVYRADQTVVILMGLGNLERLVTSMIERGYPVDVPAVVVSRFGDDDEQTLSARLDELVSEVRSANIPTPATVYVGWVAAPVLEVRRASA